MQVSNVCRLAQLLIEARGQRGLKDLESIAVMMQYHHVIIDVSDHLAEPNVFLQVHHLNEHSPYILKQSRRSMVHQCIRRKNYAVSAEFFWTAQPGWSARSGHSTQSALSLLEL